MTASPTTLLYLKISACSLVALAFGAFAWQIIHTIRSSAGTYSENMSEETSRQFEDLFLFIPAKKIADMAAPPPPPSSSSSSFPSSPSPTRSPPPPARFSASSSGPSP